MTRLVHGEAGVQEAEARTAARFGGQGEDGAPDAVLAADSPRPVWKVLKEAGLVPSTSEARRLIQQGGVEVNERRIGDVAEALGAGAYTIKLGKRRIYRVIIEG